MVTQETFIPIPMYVFWQEVIIEVNLKLNASYKYPYIAEVFKRQKRNAEVEEVIDDCVDIVNKKLKEKGLRSKYPIVPLKDR